MDEPYFLYRAEVSSIVPNQDLVLGVSVSRNAWEGRPYFIAVDYWHPRFDLDTDVNGIGTLCPRDARLFGKHLLNAARILDAKEGQENSATGARKLPVIELFGSRFLMDDQRRRLQSVNDPTMGFDLGNLNKE